MNRLENVTQSLAAKKSEPECEWCGNPPWSEQEAEVMAETGYCTYHAHVAAKDE